MRRLFALIVPLIFAAVVSTGIGPATSDEADHEAIEEAQRILSDSRFQTEFPDDAPDDGSFTLPTLTVPEALARLIMMSLLAGALVALGIAAAQVLSDRFGSRRNRPAAHGADENGLSPDEPSLQHVEDLAKAGRFDEAIHLLLIKAIVLLIVRGEVQLPDSLTGREVLRQTGLQAETKNSLRTLVEGVETSLFGGRAVSATDFDRCWTSYIHLSTRLSSRAA